MAEANLAFRLADLLYYRAFPLYRIAYFAYKAISDRHERQIVRQALRPGAVAIDVGANIGSYTRMMSDLVGVGGQVFAFEPEERNYSRLAKEVQNLQNVVAVQAAVGNTTGAIDLYVSDELNVDHRTYDPDRSRRRLQVSCYRLDDYFPTGQRVDFVKMDIQGFEYEGLSGMSRLLADNEKVVLLMEYWPAGLARAGSSAAQLVELLSSLGFQLQFMTHGGLLPEAPELGEGHLDYINLVARR